MRGLSFAKTSPIGLDLGAHSFKAVQLRNGNAGWEIATAVSLPRLAPGEPLAASEISRLKDVLDRRRFVGRDVVIAVPAASLLTAILELPARVPGVPLDQIAALEFGRVHKQDPAVLTMSAWELPTPACASKATYMLAVGAVSDRLESHIDLIESEHLNVLAMDELYTAAARGCLHKTERTNGLMAVIDLGWDAARLMVVKDNLVIYMRKLDDAGLAQLQRAALDAASDEPELVEKGLWDEGFGVSGQCDLTYGEVTDVLESHTAGMLKEIDQSFIYSAHQYPDAGLTRVMLIGGGAAIPGIAERFQSYLGIPTFAAQGDRVASAGQEFSAALVCATGLRSGPGGRDESSKSDPSSAAQRETHRARSGAGYGSTAAMCLCSFSPGRSMRTHASIGFLSRQLARLQRIRKKQTQRSRASPGIGELAHQFAARASGFETS